MDELAVGDKSYISSKRAAEICGYTQDYVGQLARSGQIEAQRIGGLWYVFLESVQTYKTKAESYKPEPPKYNPSTQADSSLTFDGVEYISASRAAKLSQYNQDYIGQLARAGKISSRLVGNRWYVSHDELIAHKKEKDALLAAVQAESVGLRKPEPTPSPQIELPEQPMYTYSSDNRALIPAMGVESGAERLTLPLHEEPQEDRSAEDSLDPIEPSTIEIRTKDTLEPEFVAPVLSRLPIRIIEQPRARNARSEIHVSEEYAVRIPRKTIFKAPYVIGVLSLVVVVGLSVAAYRAQSPGTSATASVASVGVVAGDSLERLLTRELVYIRQ